MFADNPYLRFCRIDEPAWQSAREVLLVVFQGNESFALCKNLGSVIELEAGSDLFCFGVNLVVQFSRRALVVLRNISLQ